MKIAIRLLTPTLIIIFLMAAAVGAQTTRVSGTAGTDGPAAGRFVRLISTSGTQGSDVFVEVEMDANGDEVGTQYSLHFDPSVLSISSVNGVNANPDITLGSGAPSGTSLNVNAASAGTGDIGVVEYFNGTNANPAVVLASGTDRITRLKFHILNTAAFGASPVIFTSNVVSLTTADANGLPLTVSSYTGGSVTVTVTVVVAPRTLKLGSLSTTPGGTALIPVTLDSTGSVYSASFTANFDPNLVSISGSDVLPGATQLPAGCSTIVNATGVVSPGRIGVVIICPTSGAAIPAGIVELVKLKFTTKASVAAGTQILLNFGNTPLNTEIGDVNGGTFAVNQVNGIITIVAPMPTNVSISGRITTPSGSGLRNATVALTNPATGERRTVTTSSFGFYQFDNVPTGGSFIISVLSRTYRFSTRTVLVTDNLVNQDFTGLE